MFVAVLSWPPPWRRSRAPQPARPARLRVAVGLVAGTSASVKAGSTVHAEALASLSSPVGTGAALGVSAAVVVEALWGSAGTSAVTAARARCPASYAVASVGLPA